MGTRGSSKTSASGSFHQKETRVIEIDDQENIYSVSFLVDGKRIVGGGRRGKIRCWRVEDGREVGTPMDAGSAVCSVAVSRDGKWVVSGTESGWVTVWNAESHSKATRFKGHRNAVRAVDVSPDGTQIATGSEDKTVCVWSLSTGKRLLDLSQHADSVVAVRFSPDGRLIVIATRVTSIRIYDSQNGRLIVVSPIKVNSASNQSFAWASDNKQLFVSSRDSIIHCFDVFNGRTLCQWPTDCRGNASAQCIALASNGTFIATSTLSSLSFWDTTTHEKINCVINHAPLITTMALSSNNDLVTAGGNEITIHDLHNVLPSSYCDDVSAFASEREMA